MAVEIRPNLIDRVIAFAKARRTSPLGTIEVEFGDQGEPEIDLSPPIYWWEHAMPVTLSAIGSGTIAADQLLAEMLGLVDAAVSRDRSLGGLCLYLDLRPGTIGEIAREGAQTVGVADFTIVATYSTTTALG